MSNRILSGAVVAAAVALSLEAVGVAQGRGGERAPLFPTPQQFAASEEAKRHVAAARTLAGNDLVTEWENVCSSTGPQRAAIARQQAGLPPIENYTVEPTKIFDNMWYLGPTSQGAFVITTSQGLILIDTLNNEKEAREILIPSMQKAGLDPAQIKYIVLSHGHPGQTDHTGGANYLQRTYGAKVAMGKPDWDATLPMQKPENPLATRDMDLVTGSTITLGDTTLRIALVPGHSAGALAVFIPVKWQGASHMVWLHAGAFQTPNSDSLGALERVVNDYALKLGAEGVLNAHAGIYQDTLGDMETIRKNPKGPNPLLYGKERAARYWNMVLECGRARVAAMEQARPR